MKRGKLVLAQLAGLLSVVALMGFIAHTNTPGVDSATSSVSISGFAFVPSTLNVPVDTTVTWTNADGAPHTATSDGGFWDSPTLEQGGNFSFTFTSAGQFPYFCAIHPFMTGTVVVAAAPAPTPAPGAAAAPSLVAPASGDTLPDFGATLSWSNASGATQVQLQVVPFNSDGPGVDLHLGSPASSFNIPAPPNWYGLLPDMTYTWRVRTSNAASFVDGNDPSWSAWSEAPFRTPKVTSGTISAVSPPSGASVTTQTPTLQWSNNRIDVFYYEVQVSKDPAFGGNAFLYWEMRHGGVTSPPNSYTIPSGFPLERNTTYFWRVRPRVQGDGTPVDWSPLFRLITTSADAAPPMATASPAPSPTVTATRTPTPSPVPSPTATPMEMGGY